jgi:SAM-dependent methyltransferase
MSDAKARELWDQRYGQPEYAFGKDPNEYLRECLEGLKPGRILFPAEGEGRNAVFAATLGWEVHAFDLSPEGMHKAERLALKKGVSIDYRVCSVDELTYPTSHFDAVALVYAHFHASSRRTRHRALASLLKPGGHLILEAFSDAHLPYRLRNEKVGGPSDPEMLYSKIDIEQDFIGLRILESVVSEIELNEGLYHVGKGSVIRFMAERPV